MTGTDIVGARLCADQAVTSFAPADRIKGGKLPDNIVLPALLVRTVSVIDSQPLKRRGWVRTTARVSVAVRAASYEDQVAGIALVRTCCLGFAGPVEGAGQVSILSAGLGPDVIGPANSFEQTQDLRVSFEEPAQPTEN